MSIPVPFDVPGKFWRASGDFWQSNWNSLLDIIGDDEYHLWVTLTVLLSTIVYWGVGGLYTFMDVTNRPKFLRKYKVQPGANEPVDRDRLIKV